MASRHNERTVRSMSDNVKHLCLDQLNEMLMCSTFLDIIRSEHSPLVVDANV